MYTEVAIICGALFFGFAVYFLSGYIIARKIINPSSLKSRYKGNYYFINENVADDGEEWTQLSEKKYPLKARFYKCDTESHKYVILVPSYFGDSKSVGYLKDVFVKRGYNCLAVDNRCTGKTKGKNITFGIFENYDLYKWCERINNLDKNSTIGVMGEGMGGSIAMMLASDIEDIEFCISYNPFINLDEIFTKIVKKNYKCLTPLVKSWILTLTDIDVEQLNINEWCTRMKCPLLIVATENNELIPNKQLKLLDGCKEYDILYLPSNKHLLSLRNNIDMLEEKLDKFLVK